MVLAIMFRTKKTAIVISVLFVIGWVVFYLLFHELFLQTTHAVFPASRTLEQNFRRHESQTLMISRVEHMKTVCSEKQNKFANVAHESFLYSRKYNFHYCSIPKIGSTFWQKLIRILENGEGHLDDVLFKARKDIHKDDHKYKKHLSITRKSKATVAMISRNPYSRLYSAYVDKAFLFHRSNLCTGMTFETYLEGILGVQRISNVDHHVRPVSAICDPCALKPNFLLKQETFSSDVLYVMHELQISSQEMNIVTDLLFNLRADNNVPGIVKTMYDISITNHDRPCFSWRSVAERLWTTFQIQGYIDERIKLPYERFVNEEMYANSSFFIETALDIIRKFPLTTPEIESQRKRTLVRAYANISADLIQTIKRRYAMDFQFFDYSFAPPGSGEIVPEI